VHEGVEGGFRTRGLLAPQFHLEAGHIPLWTEILREFTRGICVCGSDWDMPHFVEEVRRICEQVWSERVILASWEGSARRRRCSERRSTCSYRGVRRPRSAAAGRGRGRGARSLRMLRA